MRKRWLIFLVVLPFYAIVLTTINLLAFILIVDPSEFLEGSLDVFTEPDWWFWAMLIGLVVSGTQLLFLLPRFHWKAQRSTRQKSLALSAIMLAVVASALTVGLLTGLVELLPIELERPLFHVGPVDQPAAWQPVEAMQRDWFGPFFWITIVASWFIWCVVLVPFTRRRADHDGRLGRIIGWLLAGTVIEVLIILPIDIMVRRRTDCYCATGTFLTLIIASAAALWLTGPGIFIALTAKRRRAWRSSHCANCGYDRGPSPGKRCPECGETW